jgi:hypothetical protein
MKTSNTITAILLILITSITSCVKKPTPPPKEWNTFSCLIDGEACSASGAYSWLSVKGMYYSLMDSAILISVITNDPRKDFYIHGYSSSDSPWIFNLSIPFSSGYSNLNIIGGTPSLGSGFYKTIDSLPATITITSFSGNRILGAKQGDQLSGTFDIIMQNGTGKKIHLTQGKFDIAEVQ